MRAWFATALLMMSAAGEARAQGVGDSGFCPTLQRLLHAAGERPAFRSLGRASPLHAATGLGFDRCRIVPDLYSDRLVCTRAADRHAAGAASPEQRIERCVPEALQMSEPDGSPLTRFRLGTLAFHVRRDPRMISFTLFALPVEQ